MRARLDALCPKSRIDFAAWKFRKRPAGALRLAKSARVARFSRDGETRAKCRSRFKVSAYSVCIEIKISIGIIGMMETERNANNRRSSTLLYIHELILGYKKHTIYNISYINNANDINPSM